MLLLYHGLGDSVAQGTGKPQSVRVCINVPDSSSCLHRPALKFLRLGVEGNQHVRFHPRFGIPDNVAADVGEPRSSDLPIKLTETLQELIRREQLFPPQAQCLLRCAVRETEQHRFSLRSMSYRIPRRHDENIMRLPAKRGGPDARTSPAFDNAINRRVRRPRGQALISSR